MSTFLLYIQRNYAAELSTGQVKFGTQSLLTTSGNIQSAHPLTFGGDPFTVSCWAQYSKAGFLFRALGTTKSFGFKLNDLTNKDIEFYTGTTAANTAQTATGGRTSTGVRLDTNTWCHFEVAYNGAGNLKAFMNGHAYWNLSQTVAREPRRIILGELGGYIDEFRILDGVCEHTAAFTRPSDKYSFDDYPDNTLVLLHFE